MTGPVVKPAGTGNTMELLFQVAGTPAIPFSVMVLLPCEDPKLLPLTFIEVPTAATAGEMLVMPGVTVKFVLLLVRLPTVMTIGTGPRARL